VSSSLEYFISDAFLCKQAFVDQQIKALMSEAYDDMSHTMEEAAVYKERVMGTTPGNWQPPKTGLSLFM
jgi:hypothetical protein